jgi:hypothetical protein
MGPATLVALALALSTTPDRYDTVLLSQGGVLRGTVIEDLPGSDLVLQMPDGSMRRIPRAEVFRVDYAAPQPPEAEVPAAPSPAPASEAPAPEVASQETVGLITGAMAFGGAVPFGILDGSGLPLSQATTTLFQITFEFGIRPVDPLVVGAYFRVGGGGARPPLSAPCLAVGVTCDSLDLGFGLLSRWGFQPRGMLNPWVAVAGGFQIFGPSSEYDVSVDYLGWEVGPSAGLDFRLGPTLGFGLYAGVRWGWFTDMNVRGIPPPLAPAWWGAATHGWADFGVRMVYGP